MFEKKCDNCGKELPRSLDRDVCQECIDKCLEESNGKS